MRAGLAYRPGPRGGATPALLASPERLDVVEIVDVSSGEVALFWDCRPREASRTKPGDLRGGPHGFDISERCRADLDPDRSGSDLLDERWQFGQVSLWRYGALPVALKAEVGRSERHGRQLESRPGH